MAAGIPLAQGFVDIIKHQWPEAYARAPNKTYAHCMAQLSSGERRDLISKYVDHTKVNWAHIAIAQLLRGGYVDRVLTTNFDPLVLRACAMLNLFPGVYDFASLRRFKPGHAASPAIFHLHGQHTGFVLLNTDEEVRQMSGSVAPLIEDTSRRRVWIVVGYSGEHDPVFEQLARVKNNDERLYWIGYKDAEPSPHVRKRVLSEAQCAYFVKGFNADNFFVTLARRLDCFPPEWVEKPFTHLKQLLDSLTLFGIPEGAEVDVGYMTRATIDAAIGMFEQGQRGKITTGLSLLLAGQYQKVKALPLSDASLRGVVARAHIGHGNDLTQRATAKSGPDSDKLFREACNEYAEALTIESDIPEALCAWGHTLLLQAQRMSTPEAEVLLRMAEEKYAHALAITQGTRDVLLNYGIVLAYLAEVTSRSDADGLFCQAYERFDNALEGHPDNCEVLLNWGIALVRQAKSMSCSKSGDLYRQACQKFSEAVKIKPDHHEALSSWAGALAALARSTSGHEADVLFQQAEERYREALQIKPDDYRALNNWAHALAQLAKHKVGQEADDLYGRAGEKYAEALKLRPSAQDDILCNWGSALTEQAEGKTGQDADHLFRKACTKYAAATKINKNNDRAFLDWGVALHKRAMYKSTRAADALLRRATDNYEKALGIKRKKYKALANWGAALIARAKLRSGPKAAALFDKAAQKCNEAELICPGVAAYSLACLHALKGHNQGSKRWLEIGLDRGALPSKRHIETDADLASVRHLEWFVAFLSTLPDDPPFRKL